MKRQSILVISVISMFIFAWFAGYKLLGNIDFSKPQAKKETTIVTSKVDDEDRVRTRRGTAVAPVEKAQDATSQKETDFTYKGWRIDNVSEQPRVCVNFSHKLDANDGLKIIEYIRTEPKAKMTADISGKSACLSGLKYGTDYTLTLLSGLKGLNGKTLTDDVDVDVAFGDRPPRVSFAGSGVILPRIGAQGLALETMNVAELNISIYRVGDRIIARRNPDAGQETSEGDYSYTYNELAPDVREHIWSGKVKVKDQTNTLVTTVLPIKDMVGELKPGAYIVKAIRVHKDDERRPAQAWRWIISTDLALTTYQSKSGLDVSVRSIDTAKPVRGARVDLIASNNEKLGSAVTDNNGRVHFDGELLRGRSGLWPRMLMAYGTQGDYAVLDFNRSPLDLSAFAIGGRNVSTKVDAYVFTDRGVYRPGELVNLTAMLRDKDGNAIEGAEGQIRFLKPNGIEFRKIRFNTTTGGTLLHKFDVPKSAARGIWRAVVEVDGSGQVGSEGFSVEDFVPEKLRVSLNIDDMPIRDGEVRDFEIDAQFLYGANGSGLEAEAEARIRIDPNPFPKFKGYKFGRIDENFKETFADLGGGSTNTKGILEVGIALDEELSFQTSHPLRAEITVGVSEPSGRYIKQSEFVAIRTNDLYIGIKPGFTGRAERNKPANFNIKAVDWQGEAVSLKGTDWMLVEEDWHYTYYRKYGSWHWRREVRDIERAKGQVDIDAQNGIDLSRTLNWGNYRLVLRDEKTGTNASYRFSVGWYGASASAAPDQVQLGVPTKLSRDGDTITLNVKAPYAGIGELVIAGETVRQVRNVNIPQGSSEIKVKLGQNVGAGVYALLTVYTPRDINDRPIPRRAVGIGYIEGDVDRKKLAVSIDTPKVVRPRRKQIVKLNVDNAPRGEKIWLSLAAIDEGVLQVTKYKSPDPADFYFGKKAFGIDVRDDYARLLNANLGTPAIAKSGSDSLGGEGLTAAPIRVVSLYSGLVDVKNGKVSVPVELPDFNGEMRLMAVAWSKTAVGSASEPMVVRDPVPAVLSLPRFLAPGDKAFAVLTLDNVEGKPGNYGVVLQTIGDLAADTSKEKLDLPLGKRQSVYKQITAGITGVSTVDMKVNGPRGYGVTTSFDIQTRSAFRPITRMITSRMDGGESFVLDQSYMEGFDPASTDIDVSFSNTPGLDPSAYAASVAKYPYGCTEQSISSALPLLYANDLGGVAGIGKAKARKGVQIAVDRISNRQGSDGAFGLWWEDDGYARPWIGVYASDFLQRAQEKDYVVSDKIMAKSYAHLKEITKMERWSSLNYKWRYRWGDTERRRKARQAEAGAYAHYVLARAGKADLSSMRYFYDNHAKKIRTPIAWGHLGAALSMMGDDNRSAQAFEKALPKLGYNNSEDYYQSPLRDVAGLMAVSKEVGANSSIEQVQEGFYKWLKPPQSLNTQQKAQTIMAIRAFLIDSDPVNIKAAKATLSSAGGISKAHLYGTDLVKKPKFTNKSSKEVWRSVMVRGVPLEAPVPSNTGYTVSKKIFTMSGDVADMSNVHKGDKLIVRVVFTSTMKRPRQTVLADLLPAGMEIESILPTQDAEQRDGDELRMFDWLGALDQFQTQEMRDDRLVAAADTYGKQRMAIAYIVRATTEGEFIWPGAVVEDMYRPTDFAITEASRVVISDDNKG